MSGNLTTDVVLSDDGRELTLTGPRTGRLCLRFEKTEEAGALFELFQSARQRCWEAHLDELAEGRSTTDGPGEATRKVLAEIVVITEVAIDAARTVDADDARVLAGARERSRRRGTRRSQTRA